MDEPRQASGTPFGDTVTWITGEEETGGAYSLHERVAPPGARSPGHSHPHLIESFYVLEGAFEFELDGRVVRAEAGAFVSAGRGVRHGWRVAGDAKARALIIFTPSAKRAYFEELDALLAASQGRPDPEALSELARKYDW